MPIRQPLFVNNCPAGTIDEFTPTDFLADSALQSSNILQFESLLNHTNLLNIGTNSHIQIDNHLSNTAEHFEEADIDHDNLLNVGTNSHDDIDGHIADATAHFPVGSIDHLAINNIGTNTHQDIDLALAFVAGHIGNPAIHFTEASINHDNILNGTGANSHGDIDAAILLSQTHQGDGTIHYPQTAIDHNVILNNALSTGHLPFPYEFFSFDAVEITNTTSTIPVVHLTTAPVLTGGTYLISVAFGYSRNNTGSDVLVSLEDLGGTAGPAADPTFPMRLQLEMKDSGGAALPRRASSGTNQAAYTSYWFTTVMPPGIQTMNLTVASSAGVVIASLFDAHISYLRVA